MIPVFAAIEAFAAMPSFAEHWEVWGLMSAIVAAGLYVARVIGPKVVDEGQPVVTRRQAIAFWTGVVTMAAVSVWPMHDIAEQRLYSGHMVQHFVLTFVAPPLFLLATPTWLARLIVSTDGVAWKVIRNLGRPVPAWILFNGLQLLSHWEPFVTLSTTNGPFHFAAHVGFVVTAVLMWLPICGPWPELRLSLPGQMIYLFTQSIIPTLPAAWLTISDSVIYPTYDTDPRLWGIGAHTDQVIAGLFMKVFEAAFLWLLIAIMFFRWAARHMSADRQGLLLSELEILAFEEGDDGGLGGHRLPETQTPTETPPEPARSP